MSSIMSSIESSWMTSGLQHITWRQPNHDTMLYQNTFICLLTKHKTGLFQECCSACSYYLGSPIGEFGILEKLEK